MVQSISVSDLDGTNGFRMLGAGADVAGAGDINGDGVADLIIGNYAADPGGKRDAGSAYVVFGRADGFDQLLKLGDLDGTDGFRIDGDRDGRHAGGQVGSAGDVNGDGFDDFIIGATTADVQGEPHDGAFIVFGRKSGFDPSMNLSMLDGTNGFAVVDNIPPFVVGDGRIGSSVSSAGDVNGDGLDDVMIGAPWSEQGKGWTYIVFGREGGFEATLDVRQFDAGDGIILKGDAGGYSGSSAKLAGDVNGDGFDDLIIGMPERDSDAGVLARGAAYVMFGSGDLAPEIDLGALDGTNGFRVDGAERQDKLGWRVDGAGDVNGDGLDDIAITAPGYLGLSPGKAYVLFGKTGAFDPTFNVADLDGANGFAVSNLIVFSRYDPDVAMAGDVNADGFEDIIVGAKGTDVGDKNYAGAAFVIFGKASGFDAEIDVQTLPDDAGFRIDGDPLKLGFFGAAVDAAGDVNGDGIDDLIVSSSRSSVYTGEQRSYVIYGALPDEAVVRVGSAADQTIQGGAFDDTLGGRRGDDILIGHDGDDRLQGGKGADTLSGAEGRDSLAGGAGRDTFVFTSADAVRSGSPDTITDLEQKDRIDLADIDADTALAGDQAFVLAETLTGRAGELVLTYRAVAGVTLLRGDTDGDGDADIVILLVGDQSGFDGFTL